MIRFDLIVGTLLATFAGACNRHPAPPPLKQQPAQNGVASFYGQEFAGKKTASGEPLKLNAMTAASKTLPLGYHAQVVNLDTGQAARVRINDRGPYAKGRLIDLTPAAARQIGVDRDDDLAHVSVEAIPVTNQLNR